MAEWRSLYFSVVPYFNRRFVIDYCRINDKQKTTGKIIILLLFYNKIILKIFLRTIGRASTILLGEYGMSFRKSWNICSYLFTNRSISKREKFLWCRCSFCLSYSLLFVILPASALITRNSIWWVNMLILLYKTLRTSHVPLQTTAFLLFLRVKKWDEI